MSRYVALFCLAMMHALVDAFAMFLEPLWPELRKSLNLSQIELFGMLSIAAIAPNFSQLLFGYLGDRYGTRWLLWFGPAVAVVCLSCIGLVDTARAFGVLLLLGYVGVGAFHPEAAVAAGKLLPEQRTRSLSIFMFGGTLGLGVGPMLSGNIVKHFELPALAWMALPGVVLVLLVQLLAGRQTACAVPDQKETHSATEATRGSRARLALFLLLVCALRVVPNAGMTKAIAFTLEARGFAADVIGDAQSLFLVSGSLGMLLVATHFNQGWERALMIWSPLAAVPLLIGLTVPACPYWLMLTLLIPAGVILTGATPAMVSYSHQLFPRGTGMASALTMGLSWGISGLLVAQMTTHFDEIRQPQLLFGAFVPCLLLAALGARFLPLAPELTRSVNQMAEAEPATAGQA